MSSTAQTVQHLNLPFSVDLAGGATHIGAAAFKPENVVFHGEANIRDCKYDLPEDYRLSVFTGLQISHRIRKYPDVIAKNVELI